MFAMKNHRMTVICVICVFQDLNTLISNFKAQFNDNMENRRRWGGGPWL